MFLSHAAVTTLREHARWLRRGRQKRAVGEALQKPLTETELLNIARTRAPRIQVRDIWHILHQCKQRRLVRCFNPDCSKGKLYFWTPVGRKAARRAFGTPVNRLRSRINWARYAWVKQGTLRRVVLLDLVRGEQGAFRTAAHIRKTVREKHPTAFTSIWRALQELTAAKLIESQTLKGRKRYRVTRDGRRISQQLKQDSEPRAENNF